MSINRVTISGNLGRDPELRATASGTQVCSLAVCVNTRQKVNGEWSDKANWVDVIFFGNRAESMGRILHKGMKVAIEGKLRWSQWERDGQKRSKIEVIVDELEFMTSRNDGSGQRQYAPAQANQYAPAQNQYGSAQPQYSQPNPASSIDASSSVYDEDIPF